MSYLGRAGDRSSAADGLPGCPRGKEGDVELVMALEDKHLEDAAGLVSAR